MNNKLPNEYLFLDFDNTNAHIKGKILTSKQIQQVDEIISSSAADPILRSLLSQKLGIYYAFYRRDNNTASYYLEIWLSYTENKDSKEYAKACNYLGFAKAIDGSYKESNFFDIAYKIYTGLIDTKDSLREDKIDFAFTMRYMAVVSRRQAIELFNTDPSAAESKILNALEALQEAQKIQKKFNADIVDLAETSHLLAVFERGRKNYIVAEQHILESLALWIKNHKQTGAIHPVQYETERELAIIQMLLGKEDSALELAQESVSNQISYFGTEHHLDVAKSLHFLGNILEKNGFVLQALYAYKKSLQIKETLQVGANIINETSNAVDKLQNSTITATNAKFNFDWNDDKSIQPALNNIAEVTQLIKDFQPFASSFSENTNYQWAQLLYKVATFYLHVKYNEAPNRLDIAITYLENISIIFKNLESSRVNPKIEYYWSLNQLACAYQQKITNGDLNLSEKLHAVNAEVIFYNEFAVASNERLSIVAFARCTVAQGMYARGDLKEAIINYKRALDIYESIDENQTNQYLRAKNVYASYLAKSNLLNFANNTYQELLESWQNNPDYNTNLFAGRFFLGYAKFLRDELRNPTEALNNFNIAINILNNVGSNDFANEVKRETKILLQYKQLISEITSCSLSFYKPAPNNNLDNVVDLACKL